MHGSGHDYPEKTSEPDKNGHFHIFVVLTETPFE
jgi:hypothetical protein